MAMPCKPLARAAAIMSSGLETPSPAKKECVCRSMLNGMAKGASNVPSLYVSMLLRLSLPKGEGRVRDCDLIAGPFHNPSPQSSPLAARGEADENAGNSLIFQPCC